MIEKDKKQPIIPEAQEFVSEVDRRMNENPDYALTSYGHAAGNLAFILNVNSFSEDPLDSQRMQRAAMINKAKRLLAEFGPNIITYLKDELKLIIEEENLLEK